MTRKPLIRLSLWGAAALLASVAVVGCQPLYRYEVRGMVMDAADRKPLSGVRSAVRMAQAVEPVGGARTFRYPCRPTSSDSNGRFTARFEVGDDGWAVWPRWSVILQKEGYADKEIDITPDTKPSWGRTIHVIRVSAHMEAQPDSKAEHN